MSKPLNTPTVHSVKFNVLMNMIITSSSLIFPLITIPYASRMLGAGGMGAVAFAQSISSYFSLVAILGVTYYGVKVCAEVRTDKLALSKVVKEILVILLCSTLVVYAVYTVCIFTVPRFMDEKALFLEFGLTIWLTSFGMEWFYQALEQYSYITIRSVVFKLIALVLMFILVRNQNDYVLYGFTVIFAGCASNILNILRIRKLVDFSTKQKLEIKRHFKPMVWYTAASIASGMYIQVDIVLLGFLGTNTQVGLYQLVSKIKSVLVTAVNSVGNVMLPRLSYYKSHNQKDKNDDLIAKNLNFVMVMGFAIIVLLAICAKPIVLIMGGSGFLGSIPPLRIVGGAVLFSAMNIVLANHLMSENKEKAWAIVNVIGLVLAVICNFFLIRAWGIVGAAASIVICEGCMFAMRAYVCRSLLARIRRRLNVFKILGAALVASSATYPLTFITVNIFVKLILEVCLFCIVYLVILMVTRESFTYGMSRQMIGKITHQEG
ncbi:flippase [uncultured Bifidobacterium sp.]|uniref:flippase n=1 Tax=uncultured Bifidobacterium sp. TaxID=165187 RepID=UPI002599FEA1|nr:flippase [uncultured Bifidobacterium sp.]